MARVAGALERYRLAHDEYPETLDTLAPQFIEKIPHAIIGGQPLPYRRTDNGKFSLYSVGWIETDDGGQIVLKERGYADNTKGDWVWQSPQTFSASVIHLIAIRCLHLQFVRCCRNLRPAILTVKP
jgi:hypothetical protein